MMKVVRLYFVLGFIALLHIVTPVRATAVSTYDDVVTLGEPIVICADGTRFDITSVYEDMMLDQNNSYFNSVWNTAKQYGSGWAMHQSQGSLAIPRDVVVRVSTSPSTANAYFTSVYGYNHLDVNSVISASFFCNDWSDPSQPKLEVVINSSAATRELAYQYVSGASGQYPVYINMPISYPPDYEGETVPAEMPPANYVAMGDSFSSGEGNPPFEYGTNEDDMNECHRSLNAYPRLLQYDSNLNLGPTAFVGCAGAKASDITSGDTGDSSDNWGEGPQVDALSVDTEVVTITIGGNDIKFAEFAQACVTSNCAATSDEYEESWDIMTDSGRGDFLPAKLEDVFEGVAANLTSANTSVNVYVAGYPYVVTHDSWSSTTSSDPWNCLYLTEASASGAEAIVTKLNEVISTAVTSFSDSRFTYVDPLSLTSPFTGHELCRSDAYFNGVDVSNPEYTFHPNEDGQNAYKELVLDAL